MGDRAAEPRFLIKIRRSPSACVLACSVARRISRQVRDRRREEGDSLASPAHLDASHWPGRPISRRPFRPPIGGAAIARRRAGRGPTAGKRGAEGTRAKRPPLQSLLGSHLELLCALQKCPHLLLFPFLSFPSSPVEDPHCVEDVRHHRGRRRRGLLQQHEERRRRQWRLQRQQDISDIKNDYHCSSTGDGRPDGRGGRTSCYIVHLEGYHQEVVQERGTERFRKSKYTALQIE